MVLRGRRGSLVVVGCCVELHDRRLDDAMNVSSFFHITKVSLSYTPMDPIRNVFTIIFRNLIVNARLCPHLKMCFFHKTNATRRPSGYSSINSRRILRFATQSRFSGVCCL